ncbi:MAG: EamA family transporter [bacterium]|nr:EamA family transporter [bacterium]
MDQTTFYWTIAATIFGGIQLFFQKVVAQEKRDSAFNGLLMYGFSAITVFIILFLYSDVPSAWLIIGIFALASGALHGIGNYFRIEALKHIDSVIYFPINKVLGPLLVVILGVLLLRDPLTTQQYIGIGTSFLVPLLLISSAEHHRQNNLRQGMIFVVLSTILTATSVIFVKQATSYESAALFIVGISQIAGTVSSAAILVKQRGTRLSQGITFDKRDVYLGFIAAALGTVATYTLIKALTTGLVSLVYVIHAHYILIPIVLSVWWYKDHINLRKILAIVVSFLAIGLLYSS